MQDADRHPASNQHPILKSMSEFYLTDIWTSDLCPFHKFSNRHSILKSMSFFKFSNPWPFLAFSNRHQITSLTYALTPTLTNKSTIDLRIWKGL